jgi:hypothetical protein
MSQFLEDYNSIKEFEETPHILPFWKNINQQVLKDFTPEPPKDFLRNKYLGATMYSHNIDWANQHLKYLKNLYDKVSLTSIIPESDIGGPIIINNEFNASCNSIHHPYHLCRFLENNTKYLIGATIVEWGAGYGRMPIVFQRENIFWKTYIIIDTPVFCCLQKLYLTANGYEVNLLTKDNIEIKPNQINIIPVGLLDTVNPVYKCDLFLAMWSLSESSGHSLQVLKDNKFFNASTAFIGYHGYHDETLPNGNRLFELIKTYNNTTVPVGFVDGHYYSVVNLDEN